jgi:hypothetical protein
MEMEVKHLDKYTGLSLCVWDRKIGLSAINVDLKRVSPNEPVSVLWTDDRTYAEYLMSTFEMMWEQSVPAAQHIEELLKEGPPDI